MNRRALGPLFQPAYIELKPNIFLFLLILNIISIEHNLVLLKSGKVTPDRLMTCFLNEGRTVNCYCSTM